MESKRRILIVDDEPQVRTYLNSVLTEADYDVLEARDGRSALDLLAVNSVDLMITDLVMPEQEGIETIRILRRDYPDVKIIAMSGAFEGRMLHAAKLLGASTALQKPVAPDTIIEAVRKLLES